MSVKTMGRVWEFSQHGGTELLMLLAMADFSDDDGRSYPSVTTLAKKCRMKPRNCRYLLRALEDSGELSIVPNAGPRGANLYRINLDVLGMQHSAGVQSLAGVQHSAATPAQDCHKPLQRIAAKPLVNHQEPSEGKKRRSRSAEKTFAEWIDDVRASGEKPISDYLTVWSYCESIGLPTEFVELAWLKFRDRYSSDESYKAKKYADWRRTFLNAVKENWFRLWYRNGDAFLLTTAGQQAELETRGAE
ncbi:helix-turn-helix domain-containing protein [Dechloromonas sp. A34]|uniref:helix-turn-helix domain-containing protein n=1 Tax=Dechloromonas sp. A34 TaxID=447588 RepID=UPI0022497E73|nr:helix-turn-helix domain-containing protein [Dechloromonas sp. A34]